MASLALVTCLLAMAALAAVTIAAFAAVTVFLAMATFAVAAPMAATGFSAVTATITAMTANAFSFAGFSTFATAGFAFASLTFAGFFAWAFIGDAAAFAVDTWRFVLTETGAARSISSTNARKRKRAAGADHEESSRKHCCQALPYERSFGCRGGRTTRRAHGPQLHSIECKRVKRGALVAKHIGDMLKILGETFVFV